MFSTGFPFFLAPMDDITNPVLRGLIAESLPPGTLMVFFSPAINPNSIINPGNPRNEDVPINPGEKLIYNIMSGEPDLTMKAMEILLENKPAGFNLNCGCPRHKIQKTGRNPCGAPLMERPDIVSEIIRRAKKTFPHTHFSVKIRIGMKKDIQKLLSFCTMVQDAGADALVFHPRTGEEQFTRPAQSDLYTSVRQIVSIPLVGNGDILDDEQALSIMKKYKLDGIMIGRGALAHPHIFRAMALRLRGERTRSFREEPMMTWDERRTFLVNYLSGLTNRFGEQLALKRFRQFCEWFRLGMEFGMNIRGPLVKAKSVDDARSVIEVFFKTEKRQILSLVG
jgi:tRNA-dihydrouridine synthase B